MKKILASIVALAAVTGFASVAHAAGGPEESTTLNVASTGVTSVHGGTIAVKCTISSTDGTLAATANSNVMDSSASPGVITTKCNTTTSKLSTELTSFLEPTVPNPVPNAYTVSYKLNAGTKAYNFGGLNAGIPTVANNTYVTGLNQTIVVDNIGFGLLDQDSTVNVVARGRVNPNAQLIAGDYEIIVTNTVTP